jgi:ribonuclease HI
MTMTMMMPMTMTWVIHCDGTALPQRGRMSIGVHARGPAPAHQEHTLSRALGNGDNNEAEAHALLAALELAAALGARDVEVRSDSDVVVAHVTGRKRTVVAHIAAPLDRAIEMLRSETFDRVRVVLVPRHRNVEADALARAALGLAPHVTRDE